MLLILTGNVQIGKTRWLQKAVRELEAAKVGCSGVLAPGVWVKRDDGSLEKTGIDNLLLPGHDIVPFARRVDLAEQDGNFVAESQAGRANLKWHISDDSIKRVNEHFHELRAADASCAGEQGQDSAQFDRGLHPSACDDGAASRRKNILFVDELGQLELLRGEGLTEAMNMLRQGPCGIYEHAIVVAGDKFGLPDRTEELFSDIWGGSTRIAPDDNAWKTWIEPLLTNAEIR